MKMSSAVPKKVEITLTVQQSLGAIETMGELFGTGAGVILYHFGRGIGKAMMSELEGPKSANAEKKAELFVKSLNDSGWCELDLVNLDQEDGSANFSVKRLPTGVAGNDNYEMVVRGLCSGFLEGLWGMQVSVMRGSSKGSAIELVANKATIVGGGM